MIFLCAVMWCWDQILFVILLRFLTALFLFYVHILTPIRGFPDSSVGKKFVCNAGDAGLIPGSGRSTGEGIGYPLHYSLASLVAQLVKNLPVMWETWVWSFGWEAPLENSMHVYSPCRRIPWMYIVQGVEKSWTGLSDIYFHINSSQEVVPTPYTLTQHALNVCFRWSIMQPLWKSDWFSVVWQNMLQKKNLVWNEDTSFSC